MQSKRDSDKRTNESLSNIMKRIKVSERINRIVFKNDEICLLDNGVRQYTADAVTGPVSFHIEFITEDLENKETNVRSLNIKYLSAFHDAELKSWTNRCKREKDVQKLIRGVVSYAEWYKGREKIVNWLCTEYESHFYVTKLDDGGYGISAKAIGADFNYFDCKWVITWDYTSLSMTPSFTIRASHKINFYKENENTFMKMTSLNISQEDTEEIWRTLAMAVISENQLRVYESLQGESS